MASEIVSKKIHPDMDAYVHSISWVADSGCGPVAGKQLTGGRPAEYNGQKAVYFEEKHQGKAIYIKYENRPELSALVAQYQTIEAEKQVAREAKWAAKRAEEEAIRKPLIDDMNAAATKLKKSIPSNHVQVTVDEVGDLDGDKIYKYTVDGFEINWNEVTVHGWATATYENAMAPFASICIASISREKLQELINTKRFSEQKKLEAEKQAQEEIKQKFESAKATGGKVLISTWVTDCNDPQEECSTDIIHKWAMPDGTTKITRQHTW